jgi:purine-binding chemotaxis protein CheW
MSDQTQYGTFVVDGLLFGVEVRRIQEVIRTQTMTRVPLAPAVVGGLINLRGEIVTAIDMRCRLGLEPFTADAQPMNVVVRTGTGAAASLLVDQIGDVLEVSADSFEAPPAHLDPAARVLIRGAHKLDERLLLVLDIDRALHGDAAAA